MSRYRDRRMSLLVRNLPLDMRSEEVRARFEKYGEIRDVYLPRDYYTNRPRGFGFVEFRDPRDAEDALYSLDRSVIGGREISVVLSKEDRKTPREMLRRDDDGVVRGGRGHRRRSHSRSYSRSRSPVRSRSHSGSGSRSPSRSPPRRSEKERRRRSHDNDRSPNPDRKHEGEH